MQGVQPAPNAIPTASVPMYPVGLSFRWMRRSPRSLVTWKIPVR
jgi:hypothetical protein